MANTETVNSHVYLALHFAVMNDHYQLARILVLHKININNLDDNDQTALFYCITYRAYKSLKILSENGADLNNQEYLYFLLYSKAGDSVIHLAVSNKNLKLINFLANRGANLRLKNNSNKYPIDIASETNNIECMQFIAKLSNLVRFQTEVIKKEDNQAKAINYELDLENINKSIKSVVSLNTTKKRSRLSIETINFEEESKKSHEANQVMQLKTGNSKILKETMGNNNINSVSQKSSRAKKKQKKKSGSLEYLN